MKVNYTKDKKNENITNMKKTRNYHQEFVKHNNSIKICLQGIS